MTAPVFGSRSSGSTSTCSVTVSTMAGRRSSVKQPFASAPGGDFSHSPASEFAGGATIGTGACVA
ncbi:hypothetical protein ACTTAF_12460 [Rhodobacter capsulatus]|uniref:hypothetical protein n=1 Tax=Rhodobacter capsulatus TaxID=1061 RepID=UPI004038C9D1